MCEGALASSTLRLTQPARAGPPAHGHSPPWLAGPGPAPGSLTLPPGFLVAAAWQPGCVWVSLPSPQWAPSPCEGFTHPPGVWPAQVKQPQLLLEELKVTGVVGGLSTLAHRWEHYPRGGEHVPTNHWDVQNHAGAAEGEGGWGGKPAPSGHPALTLIADGYDSMVPHRVALSGLPSQWCLLGPLCCVLFTCSSSEGPGAVLGSS